MKKIFIYLGFLMMSILPVFAQNSHWEYMDNTNPINPTSAVTVVHSNYNAYLFQTNGVALYVSEIDPNTMLHTGADFRLTLPQGYNSLVLQGAYEDFSGHIVLYGSVNNHPVAAQYDVNTQQLANVFYDLNHQYDYFINGCCGYDINGQMVNMLVLENHGALVGFDWNNVIDTLIIMNISGRISDVLWDPNAACFAMTGYNFNPAGPQLFLAGIEFDVNTGFILNSINSTAWYLSNLVYPYFFAEYRTCLEILPNGDFVVGQSLRDNQTDWLWLTSVSGYSGINNSAVFRIPSQKLWVLDMKHKDDIDQLVILGKINHSCGNIHYIAQVNPYSLTSMIAAQVKGNMPYTICGFSQNLLTNDIVLQKLEVNPIPCPRILASGTYANSEAYITETFDIVNCPCDKILKAPHSSVSPNTGNVAFNNYGLSPFPTIAINPGIQMFQLADVWSCQDPMPCSKQFQEKSNPLSSDSTKVDWMENGLLEFSGFTGEITYKVYNMMGQCVVVGNAVNGTKCLHLTAKGMYIIKAEDRYGHSATTKIIHLNEYVGIR